MNLLCAEPTADGLLDLAYRATKAGHQVRYHCGSYDPIKAPVGRGMVERVADWRPSIRWCDLCVVGGNGKWVQELDRWRAQGVPIIGGGMEAAKLELDRLAGMAAFKRAGIEIPPFRQCKTLREAIEYVAKRGEGCAVKPCGDVSDKSTSVVGKTAQEVLWRLERWLKEGKSFPSGVIVQDRVEGVEFAVGAWVGPGGFAPGWEENAEEKRLYPGGLGPNVGESGTVMRLVRQSKLAKAVLAPFEDYLVQTGYCGNIDVNTIISGADPFPLEWTSRLGWPAFNIELALHEADPVEFLYAVATGSRPPLRKMDEIAVGVVLALPPYPFGHERSDEVVSVPIWGVTPSLEDRLHYCSVMEGGGQLLTAGSYVLVGTGVADNVVSARNSAHRALDRLTIPVSPFYRDDIGARLRRQIEPLQAHGFATGMQYSA